MAQETGFASLGPNERGLVIAPKFEVRPIFDSMRMGYPATQRDFHIVSESLNIPKKSLIYGLTFWEKLVWPVIELPAIGMQISRFNEFEIELIRSKKIQCPVFPIYNFNCEFLKFDEENSFKSAGDQNPQILAAYLNVYYRLLEQDKGRWTLSSETQSLIDYVAEEKAAGTSVKLMNAVPIVTEVDDADQFLKWLESTKTERRRFSQLIVGFAEEIDRSGGTEAMLSDKISEVSETCRDLLAVTEESGFRYRLSDVELDFELGSWKICCIRCNRTSGYWIVHGWPVIAGVSGGRRAFNG